MKNFTGFIIMLIAFMLLVSGCTNIKEYKPDICVTDKMVKASQSGSKYLIFSDKGTYEVTDSIFNLRFDSSDLYGKISEGECYKITLDKFSFRLPFLSMYENIIDIN